MFFINSTIKITLLFIFMDKKGLKDEFIFYNLSVIKMSKQIDKVIRDGKVAVIYSPHFGYAWYSNDLCSNEELLFDPKLVDIILHPKFESSRCDEELNAKINDYIKDVNNRKYITNDENDEYEIYDKNIIYHLDICWVPIGRKFFITNYDGAETVHIEDEIEWITA